MADSVKELDDTAGFKMVPKRRYTYKDYKSWGEDFRVELVNGRIFK
jgi:hypothetical protein